MKRKSPPWEKVSGVKILRLYKTTAYPNWPHDVNKPDLHPGWPQIVLMDLTADQFSEFDRNPKVFANKYNLYPEQPVLRAKCVRLGPAKKNPRSIKASNWTAIAVHDHLSNVIFLLVPES